MPYILEAKSASLLSAGIPENQSDRDIQQYLTLIETAIRHAATNGHNRVPLLGEKFAGWDRNDIRTGPLFMSQVFKALTEAGYTFYTEHSLEIKCEAGCHKVPYVHTVVTWPKTSIVEQKTRNVVSTPSFREYPFQDAFLEDKVSEGFRGAGKTETLTREVHKLIDPDSMNENITPVCISKDPVPPAAPSAGFPAQPVEPWQPSEPAPMPGTPMQLIEYLKQKGYKMEGFGCENPKPHNPTNRGTSRAVAAFVSQLVDSHRIGPHSLRITRMSLSEYEDVDFEYLRRIFAEVGMMLDEMDGEIVYQWPLTAWGWVSPAPVAIVEVDEMMANGPITSLGHLIYRLKIQGITLKLGNVLSESLQEKLKFTHDPVSKAFYLECLEAMYDEIMIENIGFRVVKSASIDVVMGPIKAAIEWLGFKFESEVKTYPNKACQAVTIYAGKQQ